MMRTECIKRLLALEPGFRILSNEKSAFLKRKGTVLDFKAKLGGNRVLW